MLVYHPDSVHHLLTPGHVESPQRLEAIVAKLESLRLLEAYTVPEPATRAQVEAVHTAAYVDLVETFGEGYLDADTAVHPDTYRYALLAAGAALTASAAASSQGKPALALTRPPGHHAGPDYGGGFCLFNNAAIAAKALLPRRPRIAILDYDAHHGNGTCDTFAASRDVLYVSTHQWGIYPGTGPAEYVGEGRGEGFTVHLPFPARAGDGTYALAFEEVIAPIVRQFRPEALLVSLGVDAHYKDPIASLGLSSRGYVSLMEKTLALAKDAAHGRIAVLLEGGYHLPALAEVIAATYALFRGESVHLQYTEGRDDKEGGAEAVRRAKAVQAKYWDL